MRPPEVLALLLCDSISLEEGTGKPTLRGLYGKIQPPSLPCILTLCCYAEVRWMPGVTARVGFRLLSPEGESIHRGTLPALFPPDGEPLPLTHSERVPLYAPGVYRLQVLFGEDVVGERTLTVLPPQDRQTG